MREFNTRNVENLTQEMRETQHKKCGKPNTGNAGNPTQEMRDTETQHRKCGNPTQEMWDTITQHRKCGKPNTRDAKIPKTQVGHGFPL
jgi:hypothetical protein